MRIGIVIDPGCDLPADFIQQHKIVTLPGTINIDGDTFADERDPDATLAFYESHIGDKSHSAQTTPYSIAQIERVFLERLVLDFDFVFCISTWSGRSETFANATKASFTILSRYRKARNEAGVSGQFSMRVVDSRTLFSGIGVLVAQTAHMVASGLTQAEIRASLTELSNDTVAYMVPADLAYIRQRSMARGEKSVGLAAQLIANTLDIRPVIALHQEKTQPVAKVRGYAAAVERMLKHVAGVVRTNQVSSQYVCVSYGGDPAKIPTMPGYANLELACQQRNIKLLTSIMSASAAINVGAGALSVGYIGAYRDM